MLTGGAAYGGRLFVITARVAPDLGPYSSAYASWSDRFRDSAYLGAPATKANMATIQQRDYFAEQLLLMVGKNAELLPNEKVTGFLSIAGDLYNNELMVVGRAVNGWTDGVFPGQLADLQLAAEYAETVFASAVRKCHCSMSWVIECWANPDPDGYNTKRSPFWRVIREVVSELGIGEPEKVLWPSHLVWSNLYKVSPARGGNPNKTLRGFQLPGCIALLQHEISDYFPRRLLFLTGLDWARPFLENIVPTFTLVSGNEHVEAKAQIFHNTGVESRIVVAAHPQGKNEVDWVQEVMKAFQFDG